MNPIGFLRRPEVRRHPVRLTARRLLLELRRRLPGDSSETERVALVGSGVRMYLRPSDEIEGAIYRYGYFEFPVALAFSKMARPGDVVADVGSNVGQYSLLASKEVGPAGRVLALEPSPAVRDRLQRNVAVNGDSNVRVLPYAVGKEDGEAVLNIPLGQVQGDDGWASLATFGNDRPVHRVPVQCRTLDTVLAEEELRSLDILKVDVEGTEDDVLAGAAGCLDRDHPAVFLEIHSFYNRDGYVSAPAVDRLRKLGYRFLEFAAVGPDSCRLDLVADGTLPGAELVPWHSVNLLAVHPQSRGRSRAEELAVEPIFDEIAGPELAAAPAPPR